MLTFTTKGYNAGFENYCKDWSSLDATTDFDGYKNTQDIVRFNSSVGEGTNLSIIGPYSLSFRFTDGISTGYVPAFGQ